MGYKGRFQFQLRKTLNMILNKLQFPPTVPHIVDVKTKLTLTVCKRRNILHFDVRITLHWWWNYKWPANNVHFQLECRNHHFPNYQIAIINCKWNLLWTILDRNVKFWGGENQVVKNVLRLDIWGHFWKTQNVSKLFYVEKVWSCRISFTEVSERAKDTLGLMYNL